MTSALPDRRIVYFVAITADGFIAAEDGSIEAFCAEPHYLRALFDRSPETCPGHLRGPLGVEGANRRFDTVIMGRATYEPALALGVADPYPWVKVNPVTLGRGIPLFAGPAATSALEFLSAEELPAGVQLRSYRVLR